MTKRKKSAFDKILDWIEKSGNFLPDPAILFLFALIKVWAFIIPLGIQAVYVYPLK